MRKGQVSLEYLFLIAAALVVTGFVISTIINLVTPAGKEVEETTIDLFCSRKPVDPPDACIGQPVVLQEKTCLCAIDASGTKCVWDRNPCIAEVEPGETGTQR